MLWLTLLALLVPIASGCGTRRPHEEVVAAWSGHGSAPTLGQGAIAAGQRADATPGDSSPAPNGDTAPAGATAAGAAATSGSSGSGAGAGATGQATGGDPIVIGSVGNFSGVAGASTGPALKAIQAWGQAINAKGGIKGHKVVLYTADDGGDPAKNQAAVRDLVETRKVLALVNFSVPFTPTSARDYIVKNRIPVIGGDMTTRTWFETPFYFPQGTSQQYLNYAAAKSLASLGKTKLAVLYCELQPCAESNDDMNSAKVKSYGIDVVYSAKTSLGAPDFTAECLQAQQRGANAMIVYLDVNGFSRVMSSCGRQGFHPQWIAPAGTSGESLLQNDNSDGLFLVAPTFPWVDSSTPETADFQAAMKKYAPGALTASASQAWTAGELFRAAAEHALDANGGKLTRDALLGALWSMKNETAFGTSPGMSFAANAPAPQTNCYFVMQLKDKKWTAFQGIKASCL